MQYSLIAASLTLPALSAAQGSSPNAYSQSHQFSLVARVTKAPTSASSPPFDVEGYRLSSGHVAAGQDVSFLIPPALNDTQPDFYYGNNTASVGDIAYNTIRVSPTRDDFGLFLSSCSDSACRSELGVYIAGGSPGVITGGPYGGPLNAADQPKLVYDNHGSSDTTFYACRGEYSGAEVPLIFWRDQSTATAADCAEIELVPQCEGDVPADEIATGSSPQLTFCYDDAEHVEILRADS